MKRINFEKMFLSIFSLFALILSFSNAQQPTYQVSLFIQLHPKGAPIHLCNGAIVQSKLILTTAACVHYLLIPDKPVIPVHPSMLTVVAGSANAFTDALSVTVEKIIFHEKFNETTMENDLALLRLRESLPLGTRDDIKWIIVDEYKEESSPCLANFYVRNSMDSIPDYTQTEELEVLDNIECRKQASYPETRKGDICSNYVLPLDFECDEFDRFIPFNGDRGTALVCNSHLIGILSSILPLEDSGEIIDCSQKLVKGFYTYIGTYIDWAYEIIALEEEEALKEHNYIASAPFNQETEAMMVSQFTETIPTDIITFTSTESTLPPDVQSLQSSGKYFVLNNFIKLIILLNFFHYFFLL